MKRAFWRPFLIVFLAVLLLALIGRMIPATEGKLLPLKKLDLISSIAKAFHPEDDSLSALVDSLFIESELTLLSGFVNKLEELKMSGNGQVRVAYFGDSIIEGDLISGKLREQLQLNYGGSGVGLVPITSIVNEFRKTIRHSFSRNWETVSFMNSGRAETPLGLIGYTFIPRNYYMMESVIEAEPTPALDSLFADSLASDSLAADTSQVATPTEPIKETRRYYTDSPSWVEYSGVKSPGGSSELKRVRLFYSRASSGSYVNVSYDGGDFKRFTLNSGEGLQVLDLSPSIPVRKIRLEFDPLDPIHLYGVSFDDRSGAYVDNLSVRGYSGMYFQRIPASYLKGFQRACDYDLIILQYGENVSNPDVRDYSFYKKGMIQTVKHIRNALPEVPILIISAHDRSVKRNGVYQTSPDIPILVSAQGEIALETESAFWNLFLAMGGLNSMQDYVKATPALANLDYTHFTLAGANKIALMLYEVITTGKTD